MSTYQLRRMVLVNAGTNKNRASQRITEIDPRGGAAIVGGNGVGKTFTLRLMPLFFGHPLARIVATKQGMAGARFIFPSSTSAVCFEYQRGSDAPEDLRLAVMRARAGDVEGIEYRIYPCGFHPDLFVKSNRFLGDAETLECAKALGVVPTKRLTPAEYRSIVLNFGFPAHDTRHLQALSRAHSFGPRPLPNLDSLVATMVKKGVQFGELVQTAVELVQEELGYTTGRRSTVQMRQHRGDIHRWLANREAASRAVELAPAIDELRGNCDKLAQQEQAWRRLRHDVRVHIEHREKEVGKLEQRLAVVNSEFEVKKAELAAQVAETQAKSDRTATEESEARVSYEAAQAKAKFFKDHDAAGWTSKLGSLEVLRQRQCGLEVRLQTMRSKNTNAALAAAETKTKIEREAGESIARLEGSKGPIRTEQAAALGAVGAQQELALEQLAQATATELAGLSDEKEALDQEYGAAKASADNPAVPHALRQNVATLTLQTRDAQRALATQQQATSKLELRRVDARIAFTKAEESLAAGKAAAKARKDELERTEERQRPPEGSLLAALRAHPDEAWKATLARVVNPELLTSTELRPLFIADDTAQTAYGWSLLTSEIDLPAWADDEAMRNVVLQAEEALEAANRQVRSREDALADASQKLEDAGRALALAEGEVNTMAARLHTLQGHLESAQDELARAAASAKQEAEQRLRTAQRKASELKTRQNRIEVDRRASHARLLSEFDEQRRLINERIGAQMQSVDDSIANVSKQKDADLLAVDDQLHLDLRASGVDTDLLKALETELNGLNVQVNEYAAQGSLVDAYRKWMQAAGPQSVNALRVALERAVDASRVAAGAHDTARKAVVLAQEAHDARVQGLSREKVTLDGALNLLRPLEPLFGDYMAARHDDTVLSMHPTELKAKVVSDSQALDATQALISKSFRECRNALQSTESSTKALFEHALANAEGRDAHKAAILVQSYRRLGDQVLVELNNSLGTVLAQASQFRKRISSFEGGVTSFNRRLQKALSEIKRFERVKDLRLDIVADFEGVGFYAKLKRIDEVYRGLQGDSAVPSHELPPIEATEALRNFMDVLSHDGLLEVDLARHIQLHGSVEENGQVKHFRRAEELEHVSSTGLTTIIMTTLMVGLVQVVRGTADVHVPWVADEIGHFDPANLKALLTLLADNNIDVVTASPDVKGELMDLFAHRYLFDDCGVVAVYSPKTLQNTLGAVGRRSQPALGAVNDVGASA